MKNFPLVFRAGAAARRHIESRGLSPSDVRVLAGAAGGAKWLVLGHIDRWLFGQWFSERSEPLFTIGSSIATWRFAAAGRRDPVAAIDRFERAYLSQRYFEKPGRKEITDVAVSILDRILEQGGVQEILAHPWLRPTVVAVRSRGAVASERAARERFGLARAALANAIGAKHLARHFERTLFHHPEGYPPFLGLGGDATHRVPLDESNLRAALIASGAIPLLMEGVRDPPGAPPGLYRDGGLVDYHMAIPYGVDDGIVLFPHFFERMVPGWFDKALPWRRATAKQSDPVLLVSPTKAFIRSLPGGRVPDRKDFARFGVREDDREAAWQDVVDRSRELADALAEAIESGSIAERLQPLEGN